MTVILTLLRHFGFLVADRLFDSFSGRIRSGSLNRN